MFLGPLIWNSSFSCCHSNCLVGSTNSPLLETQPLDLLQNYYITSRFQTFAVIWILYIFFWVLKPDTGINFLVFLHTSLSTSSLWRWNWHRVPKRRPTTIWRRGNTQKNIYKYQRIYFQKNIYTAVWYRLLHRELSNMYGCRYDSNACNSKTFDSKGKGTWAKVMYRWLLFIMWLTLYDKRKSVVGQSDLTEKENLLPCNKLLILGSVWCRSTDDLIEVVWM